MELLIDYQLLWLVVELVVVAVLMQRRYHLYCHWVWVGVQLMVVWVQLWGNNVSSVGIVGVPFVVVVGIVHVVVAVDVPSTRVEVAAVDAADIVVAFADEAVAAVASVAPAAHIK